MFPQIRTISDIAPQVADKQEIRFMSQPNEITIGCYMFADSKTFDSPESRECRGIAFDATGNIVSRPLHKFFNMGEKDYTSADRLLERESRGEIAAIYEKLDGSMIATAWVNNRMAWRSKKSFVSDVVKLTEELVALPEYAGLLRFAKQLTAFGYTCIFELTHPQARIVVAQDKPRLRLLHIRNNVSGKYETEQFQIEASANDVELAPTLNISISDLIASLETMKDQEGYVVQFTDGDMVKVKCPWYVRLHRSITFLRERDIALLALNEELDDVKASLVEAGIDLTEVNRIEEEIKDDLLFIMNEIESIYSKGKDMDRKTFAIAHKENGYFGLLMARYTGKEVNLAEWYTRHQLKEKFSLRIIASDTIADAING